MASLVTASPSEQQETSENAKDMKKNLIYGLIAKHTSEKSLYDTYFEEFM